VDIGANFRITAGVVGQAAVDKLKSGVLGVNQQVERLPGLAKGAGLAIAGLGAGVSLAVLKQKFDGVVESMLKVKDASERIGTSVEGAGRLVQIAKITGDEFATIEGGIIKMNKALAGSDDEAKGAAHALAAIGLSIKDLRQLDPAEAFGKIATKLNEFGDSGGKTALVMDIFGKSGAQLLPFLKDYVELSGTVSKVTEEQAEMADRYDRNLRRLEATKQELYKVISLQLLPVADAFVQALINTNTETTGVRGAAKDLANDGTMKSFFREGARAASAFLDIISIVARSLAQLKDSVGVIFQDLRVVANYPGLFAEKFNPEGLKKYREVIAERDAYVKAANERLANRIDSGLTPFTDALEKQFAAQDAGTNTPKPPKRTLAPYTSRAPTGPNPEKDLFTPEMNSLGRDAAKLQEEIQQVQKYGEVLDNAKGAQVRFLIEQGKFGPLSEKQKLQLQLQADAVDTLAARLKEAKVEAEVTKQTKAIDDNTAALGLNARERELAAFAQELEAKGIKAGTEAYERLTSARRAALGRKDAANDDLFLGLRRGLNDIADQAKGTGEIVRDSMVSAFDKASDAFAEWVATGKLNFKEFARSVLADLARMIVKQALFNAVKSGLSYFGGGTAAAANGAYFDSSRGVAAFANGGVVNGATPFMFAQGGMLRNGVMGEAGPEAIMPLRRGRNGRLGVEVSGGGGGVTIGSINVSADGGAAANDPSGRNAAQLGKALASAVQSEIIKQQRPGGLLAAA
jgi:lambda family phage tail tape measure protein